MKHKKTDVNARFTSVFLLLNISWSFFADSSYML